MCVALFPTLLFVCWSRLLDGTTIHCTVGSTCTHCAVICRCCDTSMRLRSLPCQVQPSDPTRATRLFEPHYNPRSNINFLRFVNIRARDAFVAVPAHSKAKDSTCWSICLDRFHQRAGSRIYHKRKLDIARARNRDYEHVAFSFCPQEVWCRKNVTKKCIRTSDSSRCARRSRIKGHRFQLETIPLRRRTPHRPLQPWGDYSRRVPHLPRCYCEHTARSCSSPGRRHSLAVSGAECATFVETRPRNKDATAATCLNFSASRSFCF